MTTLSQDTYATFGVPLTGLGGGGSAVSTFDNLFVTSTLTALDIAAFNISTTYLESDNAVISSLSTLGIYLDGALLTTAGGSELLLNGIPVATTSNISSLSDWSLDPAISTLNMNGNDIIDARDIIGTRDAVLENVATNLVSTTSVYTEAIYAPIGATLPLNIYGDRGVIVQSDAIGGNIDIVNALDLSVGQDNTILISTNALNLAATGLIDMEAEIVDIRAPDVYIGDEDSGTTTLHAGIVSSFAMYTNNGLAVGAGGNVTLSGLGSVVTAFIDAPDNEGLVISDVSEINGVNLPGGGLQIFNLSTINGEPYTNNTSSFFTSSITAQTGVISSLVCQDISTVTLTAFSTIHAVSTISSVTLAANSLAVSSIKSQGSPTSDLTLDGTARYLNMYSQGMSNVVDRGADVGGNAFYRLTAQNGNAGEISLTSEPGFLGNYGRINLTANGGTLAGIGLGGLIELTANTPAGSLCNASSAIKFSAAGINSYAGAVPSVGSLTGYNFVYGTLGVNLTAGLPPGVLPNTPGTVYLYGTTGVVSGSPVYAYELLGYWDGISSPSNLRITGRQTISGNSQVVVSNVDSIFFDSGYGALSGVSSINGSSYPPTFSVPADLVVSSLTSATFVSTPELTVSSINGQEYVPGGVAPDLELSTLTAATFVSTPELFVSSINGQEYVPGSVPADLEVSTLTAADFVSTLCVSGISSIFGSDLAITANDVKILGVGVSLLDPAGAGFQVVGGGLCKIGGSAGTEVQGNLSVSTLIDVSSINGVSFPFVPEQELVVSSLTSATFVSTPELFISSINGQEYLPGSVPANLDVSTLTAADYISTPEITVSTLTAGQISSAQIIASSINGQVFSNNLTISSLTVANRMTASTLNINTISSVNRIDFGGFASIQGTGTSLYLANVTNIDPPSNTDLLINQSAPGRLQLGGRNGEVSLNIGVRISTTGTVMQFVQESGNNVGKIIGLDSINDIPITSLNSPNLSISTLTASNFVSTPQLTVSSINGISPPTTVKQATYYMSTAQTLTTGNTDISFDLSGAWNNTGGYITHTDGTSVFTVVQTGLYQLDFSTTVNANGATYGTGSNKACAIDIVRSPGGDVAVVSQNALMASGVNYAQSVSATYYLVAGDLINLRIGNTFGGGPPTALGVANTFDLNTFFSWRFIS